MRALRSKRLAGKLILLFLAMSVVSTSAMAATGSFTAHTGLSGNWVFADFNGDHKPDLAELYGSAVGLRLSDGNQRHIPVSADGNSIGAEIVAMDVDGDNDLDIVIRNRFFAQPVEVWINDGMGDFTESPLRRDPLPNYRETWSPLRVSASNLTFTNELPKSLVGLTSSRFVPSPSFVPKARSLPERIANRHHDGTSQLRAPPSISFV